LRYRVICNECHDPQSDSNLLVDPTWNTSSPNDSVEF
jgi:nitrate reductase cytochrome c-type subunit